jgi:hypothetical protein
MAQPTLAGVRKKSLDDIPDSNRKTYEPKEAVWRQRLPTADRPTVDGIGYALWSSIARRRDKPTSMAVFSQPTELRPSKELCFLSSIGWEQQELFSFIDIFSPPSTHSPTSRQSHNVAA